MVILCVYDLMSAATLSYVEPITRLYGKQLCGAVLARAGFRPRQKRPLTHNERYIKDLVRELTTKLDDAADKKEAEK